MADGTLTPMEFLRQLTYQNVLWTKHLDSFETVAYDGEVENEFDGGSVDDDCIHSQAVTKVDNGFSTQFVSPSSDLFSAGESCSNVVCDPYTFEVVDPPVVQRNRKRKRNRGDDEDDDLQ